MKICPNQDCPHARRVGRPAEYVDQASCADCGAELVEAEAAVAAAPQHEGRAPLGRLVITLMAAAVPFGLTWIPLPGLDLDVLEQLSMGASRGTFSLADWWQSAEVKKANTLPRFVSDSRENRVASAS